ncbi:alanine/glycine:cation symporter family protein, partial [candidate division KSB1 bacterium]
GDITPFQALAATLSGVIGNGNIAGVATTITLGGPGGIVWMWATSLVGMATKFSEVLLSIKFRRTHEDGTMAGGPMYYIRNGLKDKPFIKHFAVALSIIFAVCGAVTAIGTGNMIQSNSIALVFKSQFNIPFWFSGFVIIISVGMVVVGGIKRIGAVAEVLIPFMVFFYISCSALILIINIDKIPSALVFIIKSAFTPQAAVGGYVGHSVREAVRIGVSRGLLSNEAGNGCAPIIHGAAKTKSPINQGLIAMIDPFIDTIVVCTMTGLCIIVTGAYTKIDPETGLALTSTALTAEAFNSSIPYVGGLVISFSSFLFGYSTIIGWYYIGEQCVEYLFGIRSTKGFKVGFLSLVFLGAILQESNLPALWDIGVVSMGIMAIPNLIALIFMSLSIRKDVNEYYQSKK